MLRISIREEGVRAKVLYLEGKICRSWVEELKTEVNRALAEGQTVILDFSKVTFLDEEAAKMINRLPKKSVERRNCSLFIQTLLNVKERGEE